MGIKDIERKKILVIGDIMLDIYYEGDIERISPEAPVPVFKYKSERYVPGGAANVAANLIAAGQDVSVLSIVGEDSNGLKLLETLSSMGVNTDMILKTDRPTTSKTRFLANNNQQVMRSDTERVEDISETVEESIIDTMRYGLGNFDIVVISDYKKGLLTKRITQSAIKLAGEKGIRVIADIKDNGGGKYNGVYLLKPNRKELSELTGKKLDSVEDVEKAARELMDEASCEYVLVTLGAQGMMLVGRDEINSIPTYSREVFDVTGAGDTAIAYLAVSLANCIEIKEAMRIANIASGIEVGKVGTSHVSIDEVQAFLDDDSVTIEIDCAGKLHHRNDALDLRNSLKGKTVVFTNGCFDILHVGHVRYLNEARKLGDVLIVGINSDASVKRLKGDTRPINGLNDRMEVLAALSCVDHVIPFEDNTPYELISDIQPDTLVKGGDYRPENVVGRDIVEAKGGKVVIIPFVEGKSTTSVINKMRE